MNLTSGRMPRPGLKPLVQGSVAGVTPADMLSRRCSRRELCSRRAAAPHARVCRSQVIGKDVSPTEAAALIRVAVAVPKTFQKRALRRVAIAAILPADLPGAY